LYCSDYCSGFAFWFSLIIAPDCRPVRLAYQPPASSIFLSEQTSHHQSASSIFLSEQTSISHQPPAERTGCVLLVEHGIACLFALAQASKARFHAKQLKIPPSNKHIWHDRSPQACMICARVPFVQLVVAAHICAL
jgi:hypothetical protein